MTLCRGAAISRLLSTLLATSSLAALAQGPAPGDRDGGSAEAPPPADEAAELELFAMQEDALNIKVTTASGGVAEERALTPANVYVITEETITRHGWRSVGEALATVPGLYLVEDHIFTSASVRGVSGGLKAGTRLIRVMINGVSVSFRPDLLAFLGPEYLPIEAVERIEVAKGPLSALYGANAFIATVNVITRKSEKGLTALANLRGNVLRAQPGYGGTALITGGSEHVRLLVAASSQVTDRSGLGVQQTFPSQDPSLERYRPFFESTSARDVASPTTVFGQLVATGTALGTLTVQGGLQSLDSKGEFQLNSVLTHRTRYAVLNGWANVRHEKQWSETFSTTINAGLNRGVPTGDTAFFLTNNVNYAFKPLSWAGAFDGAVEAAWTPSTRFSLRGGADATLELQRTLSWQQTFLTAEGIRRPGDQVDQGGTDVPRQMSDVGLFLHAAATPFASLENLRVTADGRVDLIYYPGKDASAPPASPPPQFSGRLAVAYKASDDVVAKLVGGVAFQTPSATLLYAYPGFGTGNNVVGAVTFGGALRPQQVVSVEAMMSARVKEVLLLEGALFFQRVSDVISFRQVATDFVARNEGQQTMLGAELTARLNFKRVNPFVQIAGVGHFDPVTGFSFSPMPSFPALTVVGGVEAEWREAHVGAALLVRSATARGATQSNVLLNNDTAYSLPAYAAVDLSVRSVALEPLGPGTETRVQLTIRNLLDARYSEPGFGGIDLPVLGRAFTLVVQQSL